MEHGLEMERRRARPHAGVPLRRALGRAAMAVAIAVAGAALPVSVHAQPPQPTPDTSSPATPPDRATPSEESVRAEIMVVLASELEGLIDPALAEMPALRRPPFNAFHTMQLLGRHQTHLALDRPIDFPLPNGRQLRIELERATRDGRYRVRVSINTPGQADYLPLLQVVASPGDPFFVAGQNFAGGTLVIGVRIGQRPASTRKA
jgi:hypothetical protein